MKKTIKFLSVFLAAVLISAVLISCGAEAPKTGTRIVTDHLDHEVEVPAEINRIAVCDIYPVPAALSVFFNSASKIIAMPGQAMTAAENSLLGELYPEILKAETGWIDGTNINIEELLKLDPDIVFYSASRPEEGDLLRGAGLPAVGISVNKWDYDCIETLNHWVKLFSEIFPENDRADKVADYSKKAFDLVRERVGGLSDEERLSVFFLFGYSDSNIATSGSKFFGQWWADSIGAKNVAAEIDKDNAVPVNMEQIYMWNPELIFITNFNPAKPDDLKNNTIGAWDWSGVGAVKNGRVYKMPLGIYRSYTPGIDTPITLLWMAKTAYPELFSDIDIIGETKKYYKDVFDIELTDEQATKIFSPSSAASAGM
jgi:iron complex transport system substrate-binding protein